MRFKARLDEAQSTLELLIGQMSLIVPHMARRQVRRELLRGFKEPWWEWDRGASTGAKFRCFVQHGLDQLEERLKLCP